MIEFSENFSSRLDGVQAISQKALYRLSVLEGEIPYFSGGLDVREFSYSKDLTSAIRYVLSDFNMEVNVTGDRVVMENISIALPGGIS